MHRLLLERASARDLCQIASLLDEAGAACAMEERALYHLKSAVDEACANIFEHGYPAHEGRLEVEVRCERGEMLVTLRDWGAPFDPWAYAPPDPASTLQDRPIGGLGLHLIHSFVDEVRYQPDRDRGNRMTLRKKLGR